MSDLNAYIGISLGFLFTVMGTSFASVRSAELIDASITSYLPLVMAGTIGICGSIISIIAIEKIYNGDVSENMVMSACLVSGFANLFSGITMAYICPKASEFNYGLMIALTFAQSIGLCGLAIALLILF